EEREWVSLLSLCFFPATLGPPRVNSVSVSPDSLLVRVSPPFTPEPGDILQYHVSYWENTTSPTEKLNESKTLFQIGNLKESTLYCFSIQCPFQPNHSIIMNLSHVFKYFPSFPEATRAGYIIPLFFLGLLVVNLVAFGLLFLWKHHQKIKYWSQPPLQIPSHFKERSLREASTEADVEKNKKKDKQVISQNWGFSDCDVTSFLFC
uniref:Fibronectin type-III domain-containing protein n=1 Tax=Malurus cyaneus samueli TaxID=2593467 RepID=A0A8C5T7G2_9PASS